MREKILPAKLCKWTKNLTSSPGYITTQRTRPALEQIPHHAYQVQWSKFSIVILRTVLHTFSIMFCEGLVYPSQHEFGAKGARWTGRVGLTSSGSLTSFFFILHKICHERIVRAISNDNGNSQGTQGRVPFDPKILVWMGPLQLGSRDHNFPKSLFYWGL